MKDHELIAELKADLTPVRVPARPLLAGSIWLTLSMVYVALLSLALGPYRSGFIEQLFDAPRFSAEMLMGTAALICFASAAVTESIPGNDARWLRRAGWVLGLGWLSQFFIGYGLPALEPSMLGKREHCAFEAYLYSVPPLLGMLWLQRRRYVLRPVRAMLYGAIAAGMVPALMMQLACMYEPSHILLFHVLPVGILATAACTMAWLISLKRDR